MEMDASKIVKNSIEALSIKYNNLVYEKQNRGEKVIVLSLGEPFFDITLTSFESLPSSKINHYSHSRGIIKLRQKIANHNKIFYGNDIDPTNEILITAGSKVAIYMILLSILDPDDEVIVLEPAWVSYPEQIKLCYGVPIQIPYNKTVYDLKNYITKKTKIIIINNPHNPTGKIYSKKELLYIYDLAKENKLVVLSDEAYCDYVYNNEEFCSFGKIDTKKQYSVIVNSLSKNMGISGWRVGYLVSNHQMIDQILKLNQHLITCAPTILMYYITENFDKLLKETRPQILNLLDKRKKLMTLMDDITLKYMKGESTFYFFVSIEDSTLSSDEFCMRLLKEKNICIVPGIGYGKSCDKFIRVSIGSENFEKIKEGLSEIKQLIDKTSKNEKY